MVNHIFRSLERNIINLVYFPFCISFHSFKYSIERLKSEVKIKIWLILELKISVIDCVFGYLIVHFSSPYIHFVALYTFVVSMFCI